MGLTNSGSIKHKQRDTQQGGRELTMLKIQRKHIQLKKNSDEVVGRDSCLAAFQFFCVYPLPQGGGGGTKTKIKDSKGLHYFFPH